MDQHANTVCCVIFCLLGKKLSISGQWIFGRTYRYPRVDGTWILAQGLYLGSRALIKKHVICLVH